VARSSPKPKAASSAPPKSKNTESRTKR
jgi:hypothetical protein